VGGLGPLAHIELERRLLDAARGRLGRFGRAFTDQAYPPWVVASLPHTPDRTEALEQKGPSPVPMLIRALTVLAACGCDFALIACNTSHAWIAELEEQSSIPLLNIVEATIRAAVRQCGPAARIGLLATTGTLRRRIYPTQAETISGQLQFLSPLSLEDGEAAQETVMSCICGSRKSGGARSGGIKSGIHETDPAARRKIQRDLCRIIDQLAAKGAQAIILGCTELPLVLDAAAIKRETGRQIELLEPMEISARLAIGIAAGEEPFPRVAMHACGCSTAL
jgi:aspartate racemase